LLDYAERVCLDVGYVMYI